MVPMVIYTLGAFREVLEGTASGPFHGKVPLVLNSLALVGFAMIWLRVKPPKSEQKCGRAE
jgi:hypothetical protein